VYEVNGQKLNKNGLYEIVANSVGKHKLSGRIGYMDQQGEMQYLPVESEYNVTEPMAVISNSDLNIMFRNYDNPFSISVPGVLPHNLNVTCSSGNTKVVRVDDKNGKWVIHPSANTPDKISIVVTAKVEGKELPMGTQEFRVRDLQSPNAYLEIAGKTVEKDWLSRAELLNPKNKLITSYGTDGLVEAKFEIVSYQLKIGKDVYNVDGDSMEKLVPQIKDRVKSGSAITFRLIKAKDPGGKIVTLRNLPFDIN
jgi:gliding motility-associated protein GldM